MKEPRKVYAAPELERVSTGVEGLDVLLGGGGFVRGAIYLVMGRPGVGKTTLANQIAFNQVAAGGKVAYVTLLAETHASMLKNLHTMRFFDPEAINRGLVYVGAYKALRDDNLRGLLDLVRRVIRDEGATFLVLDGISPARAVAESDLALKEFIVELQVLSAMTNCTTLLLANMTADDANGPEHTMVDGLLELAFERSNRRTWRTVEVIKFRGSRHFLGRHEFLISDDGITVYPRIEEVLDGSVHEASAPAIRVPTGISGLDDLLNGGLHAGTMTIVLGFTGSGKTSLSLQFLAQGARNGETTTYFGFYEPPARILSAGRNLGLELEELTASGKFFQLWQPPYELTLDRLANRLLDDVKLRNVKRVVIDGLDGFRLASVDPDRTIRFVTALSNDLRARGVTVLITEETHAPYGPNIATRVEGVSALADNIILLEYMTTGTDLRRLLSVVKQRRSAGRGHVRELTLGDRGLEVAANADSVADLLAQRGLLGGSGIRRSQLPQDD